MDQRTGKFTRYHYNPNDRESLTNGAVMVLYEDKQGTLWVGTTRASVAEGPYYGGLNRLNKKTGKFVRFRHEPNNPHSLIDDRISAIFEDSQGNFWVGTFGHGLHIMDRKKGSFQRYVHDAAYPERLALPTPVNKNFIFEYVTFIKEDATGTLWIGTFQKGIYRFNPVRKKTIRYESDSASGFTENNGYRMYASREGVLWISTIEGALYRADPTRKYVPFIHTDFPVEAVFKDSGSLWISSSSGGLIQTDRIKKNSRQFISDPLNPSTLSNNICENIFLDRQGVLWIGTQEGINRFNRQTQTFTRYQYNPNNAGTITSGHVHAIYEDRKGLFWVGTQTGLNLMNRQTNEFENYLHNVKDSNSISSNSITSIIDDALGNLWVGTEGRGINKMDRRTGKFERYLYGAGNISSLLEDATGIIWAGTSTGLYRYHAGADSFSIFVDPATRVIFGSAITHLLEDKNQSLWGSTPGAIFKLNDRREEISWYGKTQGVDFRIAATTAHKGLDGELFFGYAKGYYAFYADQLQHSSIPPQIAITDFRISDRLVKPDKNSPLRLSLVHAKEIRLRHNQNNFSFDFVGMHYSSPDENRLFYMLENLDNTWRKAGSQKIAYYYNVPPGSYVFRVKAANSDGIWAEKAITIFISSPWWQSWWAYLLYLFTLAAIIWGLVRFRSRRLKWENVRLERKVAERTSRLNQSLEELKQTQNQLIQKEKMASLGELTAGIAHEIKNPLNFVNNFSEVSVELIDEMEKELKENRSDHVIEIVADIKANLSKISYHGKRADNIVKGMLQHSRSSSAQKELTNINELADEYLRLSYHGLRAKDPTFNATMQTDYDKNIERINIVSQNIGRVLLNLYTNAFYSVHEKRKLKPKGYEPTVLISTKKLDSYVEICVKDNGMGIPQKALDKIFQPFFTTKPTGEGTGLGLSLSYDIIKAHGGELKVETKEGEFAEFIIQLPNA
jgi:signal transduction histidine kinase/ligand-binding sensor domain-containing protein